MPTYEYRCPVGHDFEKFYRKISDAAAVVPCPQCGQVAERRLSAGAGLVFRGSGFYITDYGKDGKKDQTAARNGARAAAAGASGDPGASAGAGGESRPDSGSSGDSKGGESKAAEKSPGGGTASGTGSSDAPAKPVNKSGAASSAPASPKKSAE